jgi:hypothetical protein
LQHNCIKQIYKMNKTNVLKPDILGISSATLCLIHCLIVPFLTFLPLSQTHNPFVDLAFSEIGLLAVLKVIKTAKLPVLIILCLSISLIIVDVLATLILDFHTNIMILGGVGMIIGHAINYKMNILNQQNNNSHNDKNHA